MQFADEFSSYHPIVNFLYFVLVLGFSMFCMHPVCLIVSFACSLIYYISLKGKKAVSFVLKGMLPLMFLTMIINPLFNHEGMTILGYLPGGNPLTIESILYGAAASVMLIEVLLWFSCYSVVITSDKFVYLFGRIIPAMSLVLSMALRFVPRFKQKFEEVAEVQTAMGKDITSGSVLRKIKNAVSCFSTVVTWSMENAIDTADSMKSRGYGTKKRTAYSIYVFEERDKMMVIYLLTCSLFLVASLISGGLSWRYFPNVKGELWSIQTALTEFVYLILFATPVIIDRRNEAVWKRLRLSI